MARNFVHFELYRWWRLWLSGLGLVSAGRFPAIYSWSFASLPLFNQEGYHVLNPNSPKSHVHNIRLCLYPLKSHCCLRRYRIIIVKSSSGVVLGVVLVCLYYTLRSVRAVFDGIGARNYVYGL